MGDLKKAKLKKKDFCFCPHRSSSKLCFLPLSYNKLVITFVLPGDSSLISPSQYFKFIR